MRVRELNNWIALLQELGHKVEWRYTARSTRVYIIDEAWAVVVKRGVVHQPKRVEDLNGETSLA